jgi:Tfp pilus assembly protein PilO
MEELLSKWRNLIVAVLAVLVVSYGAYNYIYKPKLTEIEKLKSSLKLIDSEISMIEGGPALLKDLDAATAIVNKELEEISKKIPSESETPYLLNNFISIVGKGLNIDYNLIQPSNLEQEQKYKRLPLKVEFTGDYADLNSYLAQLKKLPMTIRVDSMDLGKLSGTNKLSVSLVLSAFVMPGGTAKPAGSLKGYSYMLDPFYTDTEKVAGSDEPKLESATGLAYLGFFKGREVKAIINDEVLTAGNKIQGFKVLKIYKEKVVLSKDNKVYEITLRGNK